MQGFKTGSMCLFFVIVLVKLADKINSTHESVGVSIENDRIRNPALVFNEVSLYCGGLQQLLEIASEIK